MGQHNIPQREVVDCTGINAYYGLDRFAQICRLSFETRIEKSLFTVQVSLA